MAAPTSFQARINKFETTASYSTPVKTVAQPSKVTTTASVSNRFQQPPTQSSSRTTPLASKMPSKAAGPTVPTAQKTLPTPPPSVAKPPKRYGAPSQPTRDPLTQVNSNTPPSVQKPLARYQPSPQPTPPYGVAPSSYVPPVSSSSAYQPSQLFNKFLKADGTLYTCKLRVQACLTQEQDEYNCVDTALCFLNRTGLNRLGIHLENEVLAYLEGSCYREVYDIINGKDKLSFSDKRAIAGHFANAARKLMCVQSGIELAKQFALTANWLSKSSDNQLLVSEIDNKANSPTLVPPTALSSRAPSETQVTWKKVTRLPEGVNILIW